MMLNVHHLTLKKPPAPPSASGDLQVLPRTRVPPPRPRPFAPPAVRASGATWRPRRSPCRACPAAPRHQRGGRTAPESEPFLLRFWEAIWLEIWRSYHPKSRKEPEEVVLKKDTICRSTDMVPVQIRRSAAETILQVFNIQATPLFWVFGSQTPPSWYRTSSIRNVSESQQLGTHHKSTISISDPSPIWFSPWLKIKSPQLEI